MAEITREYEFVIMDPGSTSSADLTFTTDDFVEPPQYQTWVVRPLEATAESVQFAVRIRDTAAQVTAALSDSGGRADLMGRFWRLRVNENGGGLATVAQGRISGVALDPNVGSYSFHCSDELYMMRNHDILEDVGASPTSQLWPTGLRTPWKNFPVAPEGEFIVQSTDASRSDSAAAVFLLASRGTDTHLSPSMIQWIKDDKLPGQQPGSTGTSAGKFQFLRLHTGGSDYEVLSFTPQISRNDLFQTLDDETADGKKQLTYLWVAWDGSQPTEGDFITGYLYAPGAPASDVLPYHVGGGVPGVDLYAWLKDHLDDAGIGYDADAFDTWDESTNPEGLIGNPMISPGHLRIKGPLNLYQAAVSLMRESLHAPFQNADGQFRPRSILLPRGITVGSLTEITAANLSKEGHPTWQQRGNELVTVYKSKGVDYLQVPLGRESGDWSADRITEYPTPPVTIEHDRVAELGRHVYTAEFFGGTSAGQRAQDAKELFDRYGDGPIYGTYGGLSALDGVLPGDHVRMSLSSYPDIAIQARGGTRMIQVLQVRKTALGSTMDYIDAGSDTNALTAPSVAIVKNSARGAHDVDATISSLPAAADGYELQVRIDSGPWITATVGSANETVTVVDFPSGAEISARVAAVAPSTVRSEWSSVDSVTLDSLSAPSSVTAVITGRSCLWTWTNTEDYPVMPTLDGADLLPRPLSVGSAKWGVNGLDASTSYDFGARYIDPYGGRSAIGDDTETTASSATKITLPGGMLNRQRGPADGGDVVYPNDPRFGGGLEIGVIRTEPHARIEVQVDTSDSFSGPETHLFDGVDVARIHMPLDGVLRYARSRYRLPGYDPSDWTETISMLPEPFGENQPATTVDTRIKTLRIDSSAFQVSQEEDATFFPKYVSPGGTTARNVRAAVPLPVGVTLIAARFRVYLTNASDEIICYIHRVDEDLTTSVGDLANDTLTGSTGHDWVELDLGGEVVAADVTYKAGAVMTNSTLVGDCRFGFVELTYLTPNSPMTY